jgi:protein-S-isoprenylcysteine O-methyltransferase Ste14
MLKASAFEFRFRFLLHAIIYVVGFTAPWNYWLHLDTIRTWQYLAALPSRAGWLSFSAATNAVLILGILCALAAALLRTWAFAYLGVSIVKDASMHTDRVVAAGPYRRLRNPLYLGTFIHTLALALLMPPSGAIFTILATGFLQLRLISREEAYLTEQQGAPYLAYCAKVARLFPALTPRVPASPEQPNWPHAVFGEIYMWGVAISFLALGWRYNAFLIIQGVLISLGVALIARAFILRPQANQQTKAQR